MADNPNERSAANEQSRRSSRRPGAGLADQPKDRGATEQGVAEKASRRRRKKSGSQSRSLAASPSSNTTTTPTREHKSHHAGTRGSGHLVPSPLDRPLPGSDNARRPSGLATDWQVGAGPRTSTRARDDALGGGGRRRSQVDDDGSRRHSRRPSQMGPSLAHRSPSGQRPSRHAEYDDHGLQSLPISTKAGVAPSPLFDRATTPAREHESRRAGIHGSGQVSPPPLDRPLPSRDNTQRPSSVATNWEVGAGAAIYTHARDDVDGGGLRRSLAGDHARDDVLDGGGLRRSLAGDHARDDVLDGGGLRRSLAGDHARDDVLDGGGRRRSLAGDHARDDVLDGGGLRRSLAGDDGSRHHSRRPSQMVASLAHRSPSWPRIRRDAEDDDRGLESTANSTKPGIGQSAFPVSTDALPSFQVRRPSHASAFGSSTRLVSAMRAASPRQDQEAPSTATWTERRNRNSIASPLSALQSPERRVTINPSVTTDVAKGMQFDDAGKRIPAPAEQDDPTSQFIDSMPYHMSRRASTRSMENVVAASRRRSVAEQLLTSGLVSPIDKAPLRCRPDVSSSRRPSMHVLAAIQHLPRLSEAEVLEKRRASMEYHRSIAQRNKEPEQITRVPSVSPQHCGSPNTYFGQEQRGRFKELDTHLQTCRHLKKPLITTFVGVALILVVIYLARSVRSSPEDEYALCSTSDCLDYAHQLLKSLDASADPCTHFHSYVCGANKSQPEGQVADALFYAMLVVSSTGGQAAPSVPHTEGAHRSAVFKAMVAMSACRGKSVTQTAEPFVNFMEARRLRWPSTDSSTQIGMVGVLDVLMDLSVNWRAVLWFDVKLMYLSEDQPPVITFGEPGALTMLRMRLVSSLDHALYADAVRRVSLYLTNGTSEFKDSAIQELHKDEEAIREAVLRTHLDNDILLTVHKVHQLYVRNVSLNEWLTVITKYVKSTALVSIETKILIMNQRSFSRLANFLEAFSPTRLLNVIGWMFAYVYVWMLNDDFVSLDGRTSESASADMHCFLAVHESFGIVQASTAFHATFDTKARMEYVFTLFNSISTALLSRLQASESITNLTRKELALKLSANMRNRLFPPVPFMTVDQLDILYAAFPTSYGEGATFFDAWLRSKHVLQSALFNPFHDSLMTARYRWQSGTAIYLYSVNLVWLAVAALLPPSYLSRGSPIMTYSGLGYQIARQLVRVADERGRRLDYSGAEIHWWEQHGKCALDKAVTQQEKEAVSDLFALDVVLAALKSSMSLEGGLSSLRIKLLEKFSPLQMFYISFCSHFCNDAREGSAMCDLAVNASHFADAFGCKHETPPTCLFA